MAKIHLILVVPENASLKEVRDAAMFAAHCPSLDPDNAGARLPTYNDGAMAPNLTFNIYDRRDMYLGTIKIIPES